jgi:transposase
VSSAERSFLFPQFNESPIVNEGLQLPKLGWVRMRLHRPIPKGFDIKQVRIVKRASGWYAMLIMNADVKIPDIQPHGHPLGIDVGLDSFVATSDSELIDRPLAAKLSGGNLQKSCKGFFGESQHKRSTELTPKSEIAEPRRI